MPQPPRTAVLPSPVTSHANPMRGATLNGDFCCGVPSKICMPLMKSPEPGTSRPM